MTKCPYCAGQIQDEAIKCKHCKRWIGSRSGHILNQSTKTKDANITTIRQTKPEKNSRAHWIGIVGGGIIAWLSAKLLNANGIYLGFLPAIILWFACYWLVKTVANIISSE